MRARAFLVLLLATGCGARSSFWLGPDRDASVDETDAAIEAGPGCGDGPGCGAGSFCCSTDQCVPAGSCCAHEDCAEGLACLPGGSCGIGDLGCGLQDLVPDVRPADVMLMLDRSESMQEQIEGTAKWAIAAASLREVLPRYENVVRFGLAMFPGVLTSCQAGMVTHDLADGNVEDILASIDASPSGMGGTPIGDTLELIGSVGGLDDPTHANFILMLSDGSETCRGEPLAVAREMYDRAPRIQVYPVGFGHRVDEGLLGDIARASHTQSGAGRGYWSADDAGELTAAFDSILSSVIQCEFLLDPPPPDADRVYAFLGEAQVARDLENGFDVDRDTTRLTFFGDACERVRNVGTRIRVVFGCPLED